MRIYLIFFVVGLAAAQTVTREEKLKKLTEYIKKCQAEYGLSNEFIEEIGSKHERDPKKAGQFSFCFTSKIGILKETGELDEANTKEFFRLFNVDEDNIQKILSECKAPANNTPEEAALSFIQCLESGLL
ncbi:uncharacterized protein LOC130894503 [Diorhabda carinulata]|uniref:uncharacterized protein LOC130894503 n=1 Tax=Diorhabda carinulata TaxID=1163345 RepID=UPI0025A2344D|nr:uncharacterized protein LOC130894503 [Diorhabda carinulata]